MEGIWDRDADESRYRNIHVPQGEWRVSGRPADILSAVLGSCVATCMWDPVARIGELNHFMLAVDASSQPENARYGLSSMEQLIQALTKQGADRRNLEAKLFGGAQMSRSLGSIGCDNIRFAKRFLNTERIPCTSESLGGTDARKLRFWPTTGQVQQMMLGTGVDVGIFDGGLQLKL